MAVSSKNRSGDSPRGKFGRAEKHTSRKRMCADFLTTHFDVLPAYDLPTVIARCGDIDLPTLESQAKNFLRIYGKDVEFEHSGNVCKNLQAISRVLKENLPEIEGIELVNIDRDGEEKRQEFVAYENVSEEDFQTMTLFFLPIKIVESVDEQLRDILIDFFVFIDRNMPFLHPKSSFDMSYSLGIDEDNEDEFNEEVTQDFCDEYMKLAERYVKGDINAVFDEMEARRRQCIGNEGLFTKELSEKMNHYKTSGNKYYFTPNGNQKRVEELFRVIEEGMKLRREDNIFNYELKALRFRFGDDTFYDEYVETDEILDFDRQFMFSWGLSEDDDVVDRTFDIFNADASNINGTVLLKTARITECHKKIEFGDYPKRWYNWFIDLLNCIYE